MSNSPFLTIKLSKTYAEFLMELQLTVGCGEFFSLLGPSGCGKTTLLRLIAGLEQADHGSIRIGETEISHLTPAERRIGLVFQDYALFPHLNVKDNIAYGLKYRKLPGVEAGKRVNELLELFELTNLARRPIQQLSGGEKQRVAIARALAPQPEILLLDEPFSALDYALRRRLRRDLKQYQRLLGITTMFVSHHQEEALAISDRIGLMQQGRLIQVGEPAEVYQNPVSRFAAEFLGEVNLIPCTVEFQSASANYMVRLAHGCSFIYSGSGPRLDNLCYTMMVRPEDVWLCEPEQQSCAGIVTEVEYLGPAIRLVISVADLQLKVLAGKEGVGLKPGAPVSLRFNWAMLQFLPADFE